jgi:hypothetical protein
MRLGSAFSGTTSSLHRREVSHAVLPDQYAQAAQDALSKLSPKERAAFVKMLQDRAAARAVTLSVPHDSPPQRQARACERQLLSAPTSTSTGPAEP